jgi:hypothetical protein
VVTLVETEPEVEEEFDWFELAACYGIAHLYPPGQDPFFKHGRGKTYSTAREYCSRCPVVVDCLIEGLEEEEGFRGCTSPSERSNIRRLMKQGWTIQEATEEQWRSKRINPLGSSVPPGAVWKDWIT